MVALTSSSSSPGNPTMTSVAMVMSGWCFLKPPTIPTTSSAVYFRPIFRRIRSEPDWTGIWANRKMFRFPNDSARGSRTGRTVAGFIIPSLTRNVPGISPIRVSRAGNDSPVSCPHALQSWAVSRISAAPEETAERTSSRMTVPGLLVRGPRASRVMQYVQHPGQPEPSWTMPMSWAGPPLRSRKGPLPETGGMNTGLHTDEISFRCTTAMHPVT